MSRDLREVRAVRDAREPQSRDVYDQSAGMAEIDRTARGAAVHRMVTSSLQAVIRPIKQLSKVHRQGDDPLLRFLSPRKPNTHSKCGAVL